jgi:hypothetical protein
MKIRRLRVNFGLFKVTIGEAKIRSWLSALVLGGIEWDRFAAYLIAKGMPTEQAEKAANYVRDWLLGEINVAEVD